MYKKYNWIKVGMNVEVICDLYHNFEAGDIVTITDFIPTHFGAILVKGTEHSKIPQGKDFVLLQNEYKIISTWKDI